MNRKEDFLHYIWKYSLFEKEQLVTNDGQLVKIVSHGTHNSDAGPDFIDARIHIGDTLWAGNVEVHQRSSDWFRHGHDKDKAYDSVILHVVEDNDVPVARTCGTSIPSITLRFKDEYLDNYDQLLRTKRWLYCDDHIDRIPDVVKAMWLERLVVERLEHKTAAIEAALERSNNDWSAAFYLVLARSFGTNVNADAFEMLARSLPYLQLARHKNSLLQLEALLFGQAGMLGEPCADEYFKLLSREYTFLKSKFELTPITPGAWKFMRMRPSNFPTIRISQFAQLLHKSSSLLSKIIEASSVGELTDFFDVAVSDYWETHYRFGKISKPMKKHLGEATVQGIIINTVIPILFVYGKRNGQIALQDRAVNFLEDLPFEQNQVTSRWLDHVADCNNAARSQALIHLEKQYCRDGHCLRCAIGSNIVKTLR